MFIIPQKRGFVKGLYLRRGRLPLAPALKTGVPVFKASATPSAGAL